MNSRTLSRAGAAGLRRIRSVGGAELLLFIRNRTAMFNALVLPVGFAVAIWSADIDGGALSTNAFLLTGLCAVVLLIAGYYNLVTTYVARREDLVLKRLRVGELTDAVILAGTAGPSVAVALGQIVLAGTVVFVLLAAASAIFTRTVETAQVTTLPILLVCLVGSSVMVPVSELPDTVAAVARLLPLSPVVELMRLGWLGTAGSSTPAGFVGVFGLAAAPAAILLGWVIIGVAAVRRWFRWEPRR